MSMLEACWAQAYFEERPTFGARAIVGKNNHVEKEGK